MQKFGLDPPPTGKPSPLELEIAKEKASALGLTGQKLKQAISKYQQAIKIGVSAEEQERLICEIADDVSALLIQRELMGLVHDNLLWVLETNGVPSAAMSKLGLRKKA